MREKKGAQMKASAFSRIKMVIRQKGDEGNRVCEIVPRLSMKKFQSTNPDFEGRRSRFEGMAIRF